MRFLGYTLLALGFAGILYHDLGIRKTKGLVMAKHVQQFQVGQSYSSQDVVKSVRGAVDDMARDSDWYFSCAVGMLIGGLLVGVGSSQRRVTNERT